MASARSRIFNHLREKRILIEIPLVVDLDGTLIHSDMLHESALRALRDRPLEIVNIPFMLIKGKAALKERLATCTEFDPKIIPYNIELLAWLKEQRRDGRYIVLCTASDRVVAEAIAEYIGIFDEVIASDGVLNIAGENKAKTLVQRFGVKGFDYAGNSNEDLWVWNQSRQAIIVNASEKLIKKAEKICKVAFLFPKKKINFSDWLRTLRVHQWLKNCLLFIPLLAAHKLEDVASWQAVILAFIAFSLCASSVYIFNDLLDLDNDRQHPRKKNRPFASGVIPAWSGVLLSPLILIISFSFALLVGKEFFAWILFYFCLTCAYSWSLKRLPLIDCLTLAVLYTLRVIAGAAAAGLELSFWLLAFSVFIFLSLAFVKRYAELEIKLLKGGGDIPGRGYHTSDVSLIQTMGIVSGYSSVLVLALYLNSDAVRVLYSTPEFIWGAVPVMLFWISWMWMQAHRGNMHDDPLIFAVKDRASLIAGAVFSAILIIGAVGLPW